MADAPQTWVDLTTGRVGPVTDADLVREPDRYVLPEQAVNVRQGTGGQATGAEAAELVARSGARRELPHETEERRVRAEYGDRPLAAGGLGALRGLTLGLSDPLLESLGVDVETLAQLRAQNPFSSLFGEVGGAVAPALLTAGAATPAGLVARGGAAVGKAAGGGLFGTVAATSLEGALWGAGGEVSAATLAGRELDLEHLAAAMGSGALLGGGAGVLFHGVGKVARLAGEALESRGGSSAGAGFVDDLQRLHTLVEQNIPGLEQLGKHGVPAEARRVSVKASRAIRNLLETPQVLAREPWKAAVAVERQLTDFKKFYAPRVPEIRSQLLAEGRPGGTRWKALDAVETVMAENERILPQLLDAQAAHQAMPFVRATAQHAGHVVGGAVGYGVGGGWLGGGIGSVVGGWLGRKFAGEGLRHAARVGRAVERLAGTGARVGPALALPAAASYGPPATYPIAEAPAKDKDLRTFRRQRNELLDQVDPDATGRLRMTMKARERVATRLRGSGVPAILADMMESIAARRVAYLAERLPKPIDRTGVGPERWRPSTLGLAEWRRRAGAVEDPAGVFERAVRGNVTPEEADALWAVYPEIMNDARDKLMTHVDQLQSSLDYERRVAISILVGAPLDPGMAYNVLEVLQGNFDAESPGGTEPPPINPPASPQFGNISKPEPTTAQVEAAGQ